MDLRVVKLTDLLTVHKYEYTALSTPSISVVGPDLSKADKVVINGMESPSFVVLTKTKLIAEIPESERTKQLQVTVYSYDAGTTRRNAQIFLGLDKKVGKSTGQSYVVQKFLKLLLTKEGSNAFNENEGCAFYELEGSTSPKDELIIAALVNNAVSSVETFILENQGSIKDPASRLLSATVSNVQWVKDAQTINVSINLVNEAGESININTGDR
jgi:hypothetical protein